jgi:hypothetical protein
MTASNRFARCAAATTHATSGRPQIGYKLLPGNRVEPQREGITPIMRMFKTPREEFRIQNKSSNQERLLVCRLFRRQFPVFASSGQGNVAQGFSEKTKYFTMKSSRGNHEITLHHVLHALHG